MTSNEEGQEVECVGCNETTNDMIENHWYECGANFICEFCHLNERRVTS